MPANVPHDAFECFVGHPGVGDREDNFPIRLPELGHRFSVVGENRLERLALFPFGMLRRKLVHSSERKHRLSIQRMFDPKGSILIESGNSIVGLDVLAAGLVSHLFDKGNDRLLRRTIVP